jgi:hypothetical protein
MSATPATAKTKTARTTTGSRPNKRPAADAGAEGAAGLGAAVGPAAGDGVTGGPVPGDDVAWGDALASANAHDRGSPGVSNFGGGSSTQAGSTCV